MSEYKYKPILNVLCIYMNTDVSLVICDYLRTNNKIMFDNGTYYLLFDKFISYIERPLHLSNEIDIKDTYFRINHEYSNNDTCTKAMIESIKTITKNNL